MGMWGNSVRNVSRIRNYAEADAHWQATPPVARSRKWGAEERPLLNSRFHHYRLVRNGDESYSVYLYSTEMARFEKPLPYGSHTVSYAYNSSATSTSFRWHVLGIGEWECYTTIDGRAVRVPLWAGSCTLVFDAQGRLDASKSQHRQIGKKKSSAADKEKRKALREKFLPLVELAGMRLDHYAANCADRPSYWRGRPFSAGVHSWDAYEGLRDVLVDVEKGASHFVEVTAQDVYEGLLSRNGRKARYGGDTPQPVTKKQLENALMYQLLRQANAHRQTGVEILPLFPDAELVKTGKFLVL